MKAAVAFYFFVQCFGMVHAMDKNKKQYSFLLSVNNKDYKVPLFEKNMSLEAVLLEVDTVYKDCKEAIDKKCTKKGYAQLFQTNITLHYYFLQKKLNLMIKESCLKDLYTCVDQDSSLKEFYAQLHRSYSNYLATIGTQVLDESKAQLLKNEAYLQFITLQKNIKKTVIEHVTS